MARSSQPSAPRGIAPELLVSQIRSTAPYVFGDDTPEVAATPPAAFVRSLEPEALGSLSHADYFRLCLSAHFLTCATPVPTDVDNQIRKKLWPPGLPLATVLPMASLVLESAGWDFGPLTGRSCAGARGTEHEHTTIDGHAGEWFTVATAAYAALTPYASPDAKALREQILLAIGVVTERHSVVFGSLWRAGDGVGALRAAATIAHDFGDLDRVIEMWDLPVADPLRLRFHHLSVSAFDSEHKLRHQGRLWAAGELYKSIIERSSMALENHRHFALRTPRALRSHPSLRVPLGPFFDAWGHEVATRLDGEPLLEVIDALAGGAERMPKTQAYLRALHVIRRMRPDLDERSRQVARNVELRGALKLEREEHEARWSQAALAHLEDIPSRAR